MSEKEKEVAAKAAPAAEKTEAAPKAEAPKVKAAPKTDAAPKADVFKDAAPKADAASKAKAGGKAAPKGKKGSGKKRKTIKSVERGAVHIRSSFNNTLVTITDVQGNAIAACSSGALKFKGSRKATPYAAQLASETAARAAAEMGMRHVDVFVKGPGNGREAAIRALSNAGLEGTLIQDVSPIPHNGCRPPKRRRI